VLIQKSIQQSQYCQLKFTDMKKLKLFFWLSLLSIALVYISCCHSKKCIKFDKPDKALSNTETPFCDTKHLVSDQFLTLTLEFTNPNHLKLIFLDTINRSLYGHVDNENTTNPDRLRFIFPHIDTIDIQNPLIQVREAFDEKKIISLTDTLKGTTFIVGFPYVPSMDTLAIWKISDNKFERPLLKISIKKK
jgi:hypothetical protein